jgi:dynein heavy chain
MCVIHLFSLEFKPPTPLNRKESYFPAPANARKDYNAGKSKVTKSLNISHPLMLKISELWQKYDSIRMMDAKELMAHTGAFKLSTFRSAILVQAEKAREKLLHG